MWESRDEIAEFLRTHEGLIRTIARRKLPQGARSTYGSDDVFATVARRVDALAARKLLRAKSEPEMWALIRKIVEMVSLEQAALVDSTAARTGEDAVFWSGVSQDLRRCADDTQAFVFIFEMLMSLTDPTERQVFLLRLRGASHRVIADQIGRSESATRQFWQDIRARLRDRFEGRTGDDQP